MAVDVAYELEILERQRAYFASDEHLRDRGAVWRDATPEECLVAVDELCRDAEEMYAIKTADERAALLRPVPLPADTLALLEALQRVR
ncbi:MAG TPA: hypothetical protein VGM90_36415 [Kofleriaceae bacterium]|jgi:hypothetical protein